MRWHSRVTAMAVAVDALDALDPGLPLDEPPHWYVAGTRILVAMVAISALPAFSMVALLGWGLLQMQ